MGDLSVNIAERTAFLATQVPLDVCFYFSRMAKGIRKMLKDSLDALTNRDTALAWKVLSMDDEINAINRDMFVVLQELMGREPT